MTRLSQWIMDGVSCPVVGTWKKRPGRGQGRLDSMDGTLFQYCTVGIMGLGRNTSYAMTTGAESMYPPAAITAREYHQYLQAEVTPWADGGWQRMTVGAGADVMMKGSQGVEPQMDA